MKLKLNMTPPKISPAARVKQAKLIADEIMRRAIIKNAPERKGLWNYAFITALTKLNEPE